MTRPALVCDASTVIGALVDAGPDGTWAAEQLAGTQLFAPAQMPFECANILRRHEQAGLISADQAAQAHVDLLALPVELWPYEAVATRVWQLRANLTCYDAAYAALAEAIGATLVTLDRRISRSPGLSCAVSTPPR